MWSIDTTLHHIRRSRLEVLLPEALDLIRLSDPLFRSFLDIDLLETWSGGSSTASVVIAPLHALPGVSHAQYRGRMSHTLMTRPKVSDPAYSITVAVEDRAFSGFIFLNQWLCRKSRSVLPRRSSWFTARREPPGWDPDRDGVVQRETVPSTEVPDPTVEGEAGGAWTGALVGPPNGCRDDSEGG